MRSESAPVVLVLLVGPQASGKSTIARALSDELRQRDERVALVELDQIAGMALPTQPSGETAALIFARVAADWARADMTCVIAEGIASQEEVSVVLDHVPEAAVTVTVAMTTPYEAALPRALEDMTRGASRNPEWLAERYQEWSGERGRIGVDLALDAGAMSVERSVQQLMTAIGSARTSRR